MPDQQFSEAIELAGKGRHAESEKICLAALRSNPNDVNMVALLGVIQMKTGRVDLAEQSLRKAIELEPRFSKPHEDLAVLYMQQRLPDKAIPLFQQVVELDPNSHPGWFGLAHALKALGRDEEARQASRRSEMLSPAKKLLDRAEQARLSGEPGKARTLCTQILDIEPNYLPALRLPAVIATTEGNVAEAEHLLRKMVDIAPNLAPPVTELARFYAQQQRYSESLTCLQRSVELDPTSASLQFELAELAFMLGLAAQASRAYAAALALDSSLDRASLGLAHCLRALGQSSEAIEIYQQAINDKRNESESWWCLSSLRTYRFESDELAEMQQLLAASSTSELDKIYLNFALGKALDDLGQYELAWDCYLRGNKQRRRNVYYDAASVEADFDSIIGVANRLGEIATPPRPCSTLPIFIVGLPRSGTTLVEQILASHSEVESTGELPYMLSLGKHHLLPANPGSQPTGMALGNSQLQALGDAYLRASELHRTEGKACFTDKMPDNFQMIGLITALFPDARIIDVRRHPLDTCVANFRQLYARGKDFSYDVYELAQYYLQYLRLMNHWDNILPGKVLRVHYEQLTHDTENQIRQILAYCDLPWEANCLEFHSTARAVTSASSEQVRQPIYRSSVDFWRNYEPQLAELLEALQPALER